MSLRERERVIEKVQGIFLEKQKDFKIFCLLSLNSFCQLCIWEWWTRTDWECKESQCCLHKVKSHIRFQSQLSHSCTHQHCSKGGSMKKQKRGMDLKNLETLKFAEIMLEILQMLVLLTLHAEQTAIHLSDIFELWVFLPRPTGAACGTFSHNHPQSLTRPWLREKWLIKM